MGRWACSVLSVFGLACAATSGTGPSGPASGTEAPHCHLFLFPQSNPKELLGRAVQLTADGRWSIAEARSPGCEIVVKERKASFQAQRSASSGHLTTVGIGVAKLLGLELRFGQVDRAEIDVSNTAILEADPRGTCGDVIVDSVFVGRGSRTLSHTAVLGGHASVTVEGVTPSLGYETRNEVVDTTTWNEEQAYGFTYRKVEQVEPLRLDVNIPTQIVEGDGLQIRIAASRKAFLVVYYVDAKGTGSVLWPSPEEPRPAAEPGRDAVSPSEREIQGGLEKLAVSLPEPGKASRESLVVYGFTELGDFETLKPSPGAHQQDGAGFAAELTRRLGEIPARRWSRASVSYVIVPRPRTHKR